MKKEQKIDLAIEIIDMLETKYSLDKKTISKVLSTTYNYNKEKIKNE